MCRILTPIPLRCAAGTRFGRGNLTNDSKVYTNPAQKRGTFGAQANRLVAVTGSGLTWSAAYNGDPLKRAGVAPGCRNQRNSSTARWLGENRMDIQLYHSAVAEHCSQLDLSGLRLLDFRDR